MFRENFFKKLGFTKGDIVVSRSEKEWKQIFADSGFNNIVKINAIVPLHSTVDYLISE